MGIGIGIGTRMSTCIGICMFVCDELIVFPGLRYMFVYVCV